MPRAYGKVEMLSEEVFPRKAAGETNWEIAESYWHLLSSRLNNSSSARTIKRKR